jgi:hypothetical protein
VPLRPIYLGDDLFACQPGAAMVKDNGGDFIFTAKESSHTALYDFIKGAEAFRYDEKTRKGTTARTPCSSTGSASRSSMQKAASNIPPHGHEPSRHQAKCRRNHRLGQDALED